MSRGVSSSFSGDGVFSWNQKEGRKNVIKLIVSLVVLVLLVGLLVYFAPEQFTGEAIGDASSDLLELVIHDSALPGIDDASSDLPGLVIHVWEACLPEKKYKLQVVEGEMGVKLCDGTQWITCNQFNADPIIDPNVEISCGPAEIVDNVFRGFGFLVKELVCNNNLDDDNDNRLDCADSDCLDRRTFEMRNTGTFEVTLKNTDCEGSTINLRTLITRIIPTINLSEGIPAIRP